MFYSLPNELCFSDILCENMKQYIGHHCSCSIFKDLLVFTSCSKVDPGSALYLWLWLRTIRFCKASKTVVLNLFGTVTHFVFFETFAWPIALCIIAVGPYLCGPPPRKKVYTFESALFAQ